MRRAQVQFNIAHPGKRYRHEKPDVKNLLEKKDETYVDVSSATRLKGSDYCQLFMFV